MHCLCLLFGARCHRSTSAVSHSSPLRLVFLHTSWSCGLPCAVATVFGKDSCAVCLPAGCCLWPDAMKWLTAAECVLVLKQWQRQLIPSQVLSRSYSPHSCTLQPFSSGEPLHQNKMCAPPSSLFLLSHTPSLALLFYISPCLLISNNSPFVG